VAIADRGPAATVADAQAIAVTTVEIAATAAAALKARPKSTWISS
jgi:hypothetical protein